MKTKNVSKIILILVLSLSFVFAFQVFAQGGQSEGGGNGQGYSGQQAPKSPPPSPQINTKIQNPFNVQGNLKDLLFAVLEKAVIPIGGVIVAIMIIYSGFLFVTARGNEEQLSRAKKNFLYSAIGAAILLGSVVLAQLIQNTINALK